MLVGLSSEAFMIFHQSGQWNQTRARLPNRDPGLLLVPVSRFGVRGQARLRCTLGADQDEGPNPEKIQTRRRDEQGG